MARLPIRSKMISHSSLYQVVADRNVGGRLFDVLDDVVYFVKDASARYVDVNDTFVRRCCMKDKAELIGRTSADIFPSPYGVEYLKQDWRLLASGRPLLDELERHCYVAAAGEKSSGGWCLTTKLPLRDTENRVIGLAGVSRDLQSSESEAAEGFACIADLIGHVKRHLDRPQRVSDFAERCGMSIYQLDSRCRDVFGCTTAQLILRIRMQAASTLLMDCNVPIIEIALAVGYSDQSTFTRQFRKCFGRSPGAYRAEGDSVHVDCS